MTDTDEDKTGRDRLAKNVGASYAAHFIFIVFGFVLPRAIDDQIGQSALGIWDFGWGIVSSLQMSRLGIGSSVNRYVARYRASGDTLALNKTVSTIVVIQGLIAGGVFLTSIVLANIVPTIFADQLGSNRAAAGWVIGLLGSALAVEMAFDAWRGVLSGCHRWDYYNALNAGGYSATALFMLVALHFGGGLKAMAAIYLALTFCTELVRYVIAKRVCGIDPVGCEQGPPGVLPGLCQKTVRRN